MVLALFRRVFRTWVPCLAALLLVCSARAQPVHEYRGPGAHGYAARGHYVYRYHDVHRFDRGDLMRWRGGRWNNTCFGGRCGWWWLSGGLWYYYQQPIYPYPAVVSGIQYADPMVVVPGPAVVTAPPAPVMQSPVPIAPPPQFWYYCDNPRGYFPAVQNCNTQFRQVDNPPPH